MGEQTKIIEIVEIASFALGDHETSPVLASYNLEPDRVVATDGRRLAWQTFCPIMPDSYHGLIDGEGNPTEGQFPDYKAILPSVFNIVFHISGEGEWLPALKTISRLSKRPFGELAYDGEKLTASLKSISPGGYG